MTTIGIIGGSGYIGGYLLQQLAGKYDVTSLQRSSSPIMPTVDGVKIEQLEYTQQTFDIVINTSYNLGKSTKETEQQNEQVLKTIQQISHGQTKIIHLSSLAVFGFCLDKPIKPQPVPLTYDYAYVQSKVHMETLLLSTIPHDQLSIIRLGNVWGPGNNSWTQPVADALQWSLPVLYKGNSFSNITYIHHIVTYIDFLIATSQHQLFHHLAEFSHITWQQIILELSTHLGVEPLEISHIPRYPKNLSDDLYAAYSSSSLFNCIKQLRDGRFSSAYFPKVLLTRIQSIVQRFKPTNGTIGFAPYQPDPTFYWILSRDQQFEPITLPGWTPSHSWEEVNNAVTNWMDKTGFTPSA